MQLNVEGLIEQGRVGCNTLLIDTRRAVRGTRSSHLHEHEAVHMYDKYDVPIGGLGSGYNSTPACAGDLLRSIDH